MNNLSLTSAELDRLLKVFSGLLAILGLISFFIYRQIFHAEITPSLMRAFATAVPMATLAFGVFYKVAWRWPLAAKWMRRPVVHGVWFGQLQSDFSKIPGEPLKLPIVFVIRQTYLTLSVESFTSSQEGESRLEALLKNSKTDVARLCYVFELRKSYPGAQAVVSGAGDLKLVAEGKELRGTYWTNSPTHGEIGLTLLGRDCKGISCFDDARRKWPIGIGTQ